MPLPNKNNLQTLDIAYLGQPFVQVEARSLNTKSLDIAYLGQPFVVSATGFNVYVNAAGAWKQVSAIYVKDSGTWKPATDVYVKVAGIWKA
jgi:hypothetical protein